MGDGVVRFGEGAARLEMGGGDTLFLVELCAADGVFAVISRALDTIAYCQPGRNPIFKSKAPSILLARWRVISDFRQMT